MKCSIIGYPRIGKLRELKFNIEKYFRGEISLEELEDVAKELRKEHWNSQKEAGIDYICSNDFSYYDNMLDTTVLLNCIPKRYIDLGINNLDTYFAMARGYQGDEGDVKAFSMKKWFNTNYHYMVPELYDDTKIKLASNKPFDEYIEAISIGIKTKIVLIGGFTFLKLAKYKGSKRINDYADDIVDAYTDILKECNKLGVEYIQIDEPILVTDLEKEDIKLFNDIYNKVLKNKGNVKVIIQTYFGDVRDCYETLVNLDIDGLGIDFIEGKKSKELIQKYNFPKDKVLFAGLINGKNIWKTEYKKVLSEVEELNKYVDNIVLNTSCSLLHVPYTLDNETKLQENVKKYFSFAKEKLTELREITDLLITPNYNKEIKYTNNKKIFEDRRSNEDNSIREKVNKLTEEDFIRLPLRKERALIQRQVMSLPILPTTTIGSFPQTAEVKKNRSLYKKGEISKAEYDKKIKEFIKDCVRLQEEIGIDVLVHGEYERNDMVEYFGENLSGYIFTEKAWVQSYGTRCVKPPIIFGDIKRKKPITVEYSTYAKSLTNKPMKGMLTGPVTILNWSFPREDISLKEIAYQIALAIRDEVLDLEANGINIIQIDEAALKEKLPIRKNEYYSEYLDWAIKAFRLVHSKVKKETQIHTHMCYSEFENIIKDIDNMDADVISFEASRADLSIIDCLNEKEFKTQVGPGVYDIHSPRVPSIEELERVIKIMINKIDKKNLWINPDCGLKTRGEEETKLSLINMVKATKKVRELI